MKTLKIIMIVITVVLAIAAAAAAVYVFRDRIAEFFETAKDKYSPYVKRFTKEEAEDFADI